MTACNGQVQLWLGKQLLYAICATLGAKKLTVAVVNTLRPSCTAEVVAAGNRVASRRQLATSAVET
jgi:hypothetical protein